MKNFDPVGYTRDKWSDTKRTKNKPSSCAKAHSFCNFQYEWATGNQKMRSINRPVNSTLPNIDLPLPAQKVITVNYDSMTQENLDDWVAQSLNRNLGSMINPQKKFFLPPQYDEDLKHRYRKNKQIKKTGEDDTYFNSNRTQKKTKGYLSNERKKKISVNDLCFDYKQLQPHQEMIGTPIKIRQMKKVQKKQIRRRNAILLNHDVHYARFLKEMNKQKGNVTDKKEEVVVAPQKQMIYSYNLESMGRKSCYEDVPNSIIQKQYERIKEPDHDFLNSHRALMDNQQKLHEKYRLMMNENTENAISAVKSIANNKTTEQTLNFFMNMKRQPSINSNNKNVTNTQNPQPIKDQKYLDNKVTKLLNDMQVQSEYIDADMSKFNIHSTEIFREQANSSPHTKWIMKGQQKIAAKQNLLAIDCYKQAIILQPRQFIAVFNIAVLLQKQNMLESARLWFNLASQFKTDEEPVSFGIALVALKQLRYHQSLDRINQLIQKIESNKKDKPQPVYYYVRALCYKELGMHKQAKSDYLNIEKLFKPSNYNVLSDFIFSFVYHKVRRIPLHFNCLSYMKFRENLHLVLFDRKKKVKQDGQSLPSIANKLIQCRFFKRFSLNLIKKMLSMATYEQKNQGEIIFSNKETTSIIISGLVSMKSHEKDFMKPDMMSILEDGGIIGSGQLDNNISTKPNNWFQAISKVELLTISKRDFNMFWKGQITFQVDFKLNFIKNVALFKGLSQCTLLKLCELLQPKVYERGNILFNDCSYRVDFISKVGKGYGLAKTNQRTDPRIVKDYSQPSAARGTAKTRGKCRIYSLIKKHIFKFNEMKFNRLKYPGIFIVTRGSVELEDDRGFRVSNMINERDFFGENLVIESDGFHKYGRMVVESEKLQVLLLDIENLAWLFNEQDKQIMMKNCEKREVIQTVRFLRNRFNECLDIKLKQKPNLNI